MMNLWVAFILTIYCVAFAGIMAVVWALIAHVVTRLIGKEHKPSSSVIPPGSRSIIDVRHPRGHRVALTIAVLSGLVGAGGIVLYCAGALGDHPVFMALSVPLVAISTVVAGIIFGTSDRSFYT